MTSILDRIFRPDERVALFIDGANLYSMSKALQFDLDYRKLLEEFKRRCKLIRAYYYTALVEDQDFSPIRPLVDWLDYNGYTLVTKSAREYTDPAGRRRFKGDMDVDIAVDMLEAAAWLDHAVLVSGDGDFVSLVYALQRKGVRVSVISTIRSNPPMTADDLRRQADHFIELSDLTLLVGRLPRSQGGSASAGAYDDDDDDRP